MIMHGTWYKGPQLAHTHSSSAPSTSDQYHQFRSYPSFVVTPYHDNPSAYEKSFPSAASTPLLVDSVFNGVSGVGGNGGHLTVLSPTIKIEQNYNEPLTAGVEDYALNLVDCSVAENGHFKKPSNYIWSTVNSDSETNNNTINGGVTTTTTTQIPITNTTASLAQGTPPTPPPDTQLSVEQSLKATYNNSLKQLEETQQLIQLAHGEVEEVEDEQEQHQHQQGITKNSGVRIGVVTSSSSSQANKTNKLKTSLSDNHHSSNHLNSHSHPPQHSHSHSHSHPHSHSHTHSHHGTSASGGSSAMPIGGVQGQNPTQGLVHWMSAVMAEHMTGQTHHDPTAVGMHYMWNGNVDHYGQHNKEIGDHNFWPPTPPTTASAALKTKMNDHHNNLQKGHFIDDNRLDHHAVTPQGGGVLGPSGPGHHGNHVGHHGSSAAAALLVVPQPINATKIGASLGGGGGGGGAGTGRKYQCKMCPQIFTSKADLQLHTQMHMRESKPYKCTQCSKAFANSSYLSQHTRIHLGIKPYRCEICQRKFTQLSHLQQHIRTHTGDKPYKCRHPGCQKAFSQLSNLQSHSRCHQTDKPFKCNSCYKCFSDENSLLDHIPKHKESKHLKTHICQYCGKSYTQETYLNKHMQKHSERTDKRPPIVVTNAGGVPGTPGSVSGGGSGAGAIVGAGGVTVTATTGNSNPAVGTNSSNSNTNNPATTGVGGGGGGGGAGSNHNQHNRNNLTLPPVTIAPTDNSYWPKVSPDSAANMNDVMHQQTQQQQQHHNQHSHQQQQHQQQQQQQQHHNGQQPTSQQQHHTQQANGQQQQQQPPTQQQQAHMDAYGGHQQAGGPNAHNDLQNHHRMNENGRDDLVSTPSTVGPYDASSITKTTTNSAFTPINSMPPHLNSLSHHAMAQRPYLYDAISFQNKNVNQNNASNTFPNQLISLHQIRNYAHQPGGLTMAGEHLLGVSVGPGKDKG